MQNTASITFDEIVVVMISACIKSVSMSSALLM